MAKITLSAARERIEFLKKELERHNYNYYVLNAPTITDFEFDLLMGELQGLEKMFPELATEDSPTRHVGSDLSAGSAGSDFVQVPHRWPMLSLGNTYDREELYEFDGRIRKGTEVLLMSTGARYSVLEVGHLRPIGLDPCEELAAGDVGYFTASIKNVADTQVGDTVTEANRPTAEALPGYRPARPMVFCGIYTEDGSKYPDLRDALEKLKLNDASLSFEPESSVALGFGFRCGFLGMLHMEIIQERLEREFDLELVTTLPSVIYKVVKTDGSVVMVDNPHNYPDVASIAEAYEPYVKVSIITPNEFVGNIMPLCQDRRGEYKNMQYLDQRLVELHYEMPLNEIIYDFFDTLKARTKGYASLDYELSEYKTSDLVKVDMLLNGDQVDALSFIAHREKAYPRARKLCEKLKENIPRQLFEVPIQAAIGGKIIARETVKAMRKDVLAKCYGGDITRKKKLLEKQKEGKKKMRQLGTVQIPTEAFLAVLKLDE